MLSKMKKIGLATTGMLTMSISVLPSVALADTGMNVQAKQALQQYQDFLNNPALYPNISGAALFFDSILKLLSFILGFAGMFLVVLLGVRIVADMLIIGLGLSVDGEGGFGATIGRVSSFRGENAERAATLDYRGYFKEFWSNILISLVCAGLLLTGQIYPLTSKLLTFAGTGIDALMNIDLTVPNNAPAGNAPANNAPANNTPANNTPAPAANAQSKTH